MAKSSTGLRSRGYQVRILAAAPSHDFIDRLMPEVEAQIGKRFWGNVNKDGSVVRPEIGPCWEWGGGGYGKFRFYGQKILAHRFAWELANGPIPFGLVVRHVCDNPRCVRPAHLSIGTHQDNADDATERGRRNGLGPMARRRKHGDLVRCLSCSATKAQHDRGFACDSFARAS